MKRSKGFTLIELLVVVAIIALLVSILMPALGRARELARRAVCMANMKSVGSAIAMYRQTNNDVFPLIRDAIDPNGTFVTSNDSYEWGPPHIRRYDGWGTAVQQNLYLLVSDGTPQGASYVDEKHFICPSSGQSAIRRFAGTDEEPVVVDGQDVLNFGFPSKDHISYGYQYTGNLRNPGREENYQVWLEQQSASSPRWPHLRDTVAIVADRGDQATDPDLTLRSPNHQGAGQSVLFVGTHVVFATAEFNKAGYKDNNIYAKDMRVSGANHDLYSITNPNQHDGWEPAESRYDSIIVWKTQ